MEHSNDLIGRLSRIDVLIGGRSGTDECFYWTVEQSRCSGARSGTDECFDWKVEQGSYWRAETKTGSMSSHWIAERNRRML